LACVQLLQAEKEKLELFLAPSYSAEFTGITILYFLVRFLRFSSFSHYLHPCKLSLFPFSLPFFPTTTPQMDVSNAVLYYSILPSPLTSPVDLSAKFTTGLQIDEKGGKKKREKKKKERISVEIKEEVIKEVEINAGHTFTHYVPSSSTSWEEVEEKPPPKVVCIPSFSSFLPPFIPPLFHFHPILPDSTIPIPSIPIHIPIPFPPSISFIFQFTCLFPILNNRKYQNMTTKWIFSRGNVTLGTWLLLTGSQ
jgi:hypothetical protein